MLIKLFCLEYQDFLCKWSLIFLYQFSSGLVPCETDSHWTEHEQPFCLACIAGENEEGDGRQKSQGKRKRNMFFPSASPTLSICALAPSLPLAIPKFSRGLGRVSNFNQSINWHHQMKDLVEIGHLTKYDAFRANRDRVMDLEKNSSKSIQMSLILRQHPPKSYKLLKFLWFPWCCLKWANIAIFISASFK